MSTSEIDGLYSYQNDLITVQNARGLGRVVRFQLNARQDSITEVLERNPDLLRVPTTGSIVGSRFFYIANRQADRLDADGRLSPLGSSPRLTVVRVVDLGRQEQGRGTPILVTDRAV